MKKTLFAALIMLGFIFVGCEDNNIIDPIYEGEIALFSTPSGAEIFVNGVYSSTTPDTITTDVGNQAITFSLTNYRDTTITIGVSDENLELLNVALTPIRVHYGLIKVYETGNGSTVDQPSGIDLSAGVTIAISQADSLDADVYYTGSNFTVRSANPYLSDDFRSTAFYEGNSSNLNDGVDSPEYTTNWVDNMPDDVDGNYYYLYDEDGNYSKFKVVNTGGSATWGDPKWVEVEWIYIQGAGIRNF